MSTAIETRLMDFHANHVPLPGIVPVDNRLSLIAQLIDSIRRVKFVDVIRHKDWGSDRSDPSSPYFDPLRAASRLAAHGDFEEACWLVFLATHSGKNLRTSWRLSAELYRNSHDGGVWNWTQVSTNPKEYSQWLSTAYKQFGGKFGNHRKYESLKPATKGTASVVASYVNWVLRAGSHAALFGQAVNRAGATPRSAFAELYVSMDEVRRFGRTGKFDYLTMISKLGLASIDANATYMKGATGPLRGARLLFTGQIDSKSNARTLEAELLKLEAHLSTGMQVLEDSLCNWQKSPNVYARFDG